MPCSIGGFFVHTAQAWASAIVHPEYRVPSAEHSSRVRSGTLPLTSHEANRLESISFVRLETRFDLHGVEAGL